jgi:chemotaxis protein CheC
MTDDHKKGKSIPLTTQQKDALGELINIGFGRAASALSILVGRRVLIEAPYVDLYPLPELNGALSNISASQVTSVNQMFTGRISGAAVLLMDVPSSTALVDLLSGGEGSPHEQVTQEDIEGMQEVGNILLNAFTGSFGNLLQVHISFTVPHVNYASLQNMLDSLTIDHRELEYALLVKVNFKVTSKDISGYVVIVMGLHSLDAMLDAMQEAGYIN